MLGSGLSAATPPSAAAKEKGSKGSARRANRAFKVRQKCALDERKSGLGANHATSGDEDLYPTRIANGEPCQGWFTVRRSDSPRRELCKLRRMARLLRDLVSFCRKTQLKARKLCISALSVKGTIRRKTDLRTWTCRDLVRQP